MARRIIGPFNRVEGDLEVQLDIADGQVQDAWVVSPLYRGFEQILHGKQPIDALVYTPRICGICSVSQSVAAATALAQIQGLEMPTNGKYAINLILANENVADHLTHFYLFFMPDFARECYRQQSWYADIVARFQAINGSAARQVLPARANFMHLMGLLAGKWPHSLAIQPGGSSRAVAAQEKARLSAILFAFREFLQQHLFTATLEEIIELDSVDALRAWQNRQPYNHGDLRRFLHVSDALGLERAGRAADRFMSYGAYRQLDGTLFKRGVWDKGPLTLDPELIGEDLAYSWMAHREQVRHPYEGVTIPDPEAADSYTWCKAPRLDGQVVEVGALARQLIDGHPLIVDLVRESGGNVRNRVIARLLEIARLVPVMEQWADSIRPRESFCEQATIPDEAEGCGLIEAARGSLGHWLRIRRGRIINYQIIAPTTWNFSPRDRLGVRGALEQALVGTAVENAGEDPVMVQHIVRSFDPCMVCTVH